MLSSQRAIKQAPTSSLVNGIIILHSRRYVGVFCIDIQSRSNIDFVDHSILTELYPKAIEHVILLFDPECVTVAEKTHLRKRNVTESSRPQYPASCHVPTS